MDSTFSRSVAAQGAALCSVQAARECGILDGSPVAVAPGLAEMEKQLFLKLFAAVRDRREKRGDELSADEIGHMFTFVFARAAEAVSEWVNHHTPDFSAEGLFEGDVPLYADERLCEAFRESDYPARCAEQYLEWSAAGNAGNADPLLSLFEAMKWCFRLSVHYAIVLAEQYAECKTGPSE